MFKCNKRQKEIINGELAHRCINKEHSQYREIVPDSVCHECPLARFKVKSCKEKQLEERKKEYAPPQLLQTAEGYPPCPYRTPDGNGGQSCAITNLPVTQEICHRCDMDTKHEADSTPSFGRKLKNYYGAIRRWVAFGRPTRTQEEIDLIFEVHCNRCERYDREKHACKSCGCSISKESSPLGNKLAMATEHCPLGRF